MDRLFLIIRTALLWHSVNAEEESILFGAKVSDFDISEAKCPDPNILIGPSFKSGVETTNQYQANGS